jgi:hypothetical protein
VTATTPALTFETRQRPGPSIALPLVLIGLGGVFLLTNLGYISGLSWNRFAQLWPVILVIIGADLLLRPRSMIAAIIAEVAIVGAALIFLVAAPPIGVVNPGAFVASENVAREGATEMSLTLGYGAGDLSLSGGASDLLAVRSTRQDVDLQRVVRSGNTAAVSVRSDTPSPTFVTTGRSWDVRVPSDIPLALTLDLGAGDFNVDLRDVMITRATVNNGASDLTIGLPTPKGEVPITISTGASSVTLEAPVGTEYRVTTTGGLNSIAGTRETAGYAAARDRLTIAISAGMSSITIR